VGWRAYGGDEWNLEQVATGSYAAFLQYRQDIRATRGGVFFDIHQAGSGFILRLSGDQRLCGAGPTPGELWKRVQTCLLRFEDGEFWTGNCLMTHSQWRRYVHTGDLPDYES
jgi:hypothetical protein